MRLLDLFCGGGGASVGYYRAGFDVVGVDLNPQPFYPFEFVQANALSLDYDFLQSFDVIHASPPCQQYSCGSALARKRGYQYPDLVHPVRAMLIASGLPYIMENVVGSPVKGIGLCGSMFGLGVRRHRIFESNVKIDIPSKCSCRGKSWITVAGNSYPKNEGAHAMGINWPMDKDQLTECIPPIYTEYLGEKLRIIVSEHQAITVANHVFQDVTVSDLRVVSVSKSQPVTVSEGPGFTVSNRRDVPVTRRCADCLNPLPDGTARRKFCNDNCRLRAFRKANHSVTESITTP